MTDGHSPHRFSYNAMGAVFELQLVHTDRAYAASAAAEVFRLIDRLEQLLSRYIPNSDISRINALKVGESTRVSLETFECLRQCRELFQLSDGVFDVTIGALYRIWLNEDKSLRQPSAAEVDEARAHVGTHHIKLNTADFSITMIGGPVRLDLGGIGKGFALDRAVELLADWEIDAYMLNGGQSSLRLGAPPDDKGWPITFSDPFHHYQVFREMNLSHIAVSGSALQKGRHIIDPRSAQPVENRRAAWSLHPSAAFADGWSTALMIMGIDEIGAACRANVELQAVVLINGDEPLDERILYFGF